eukprot:COSAG05_NODE_51_length_23916_cov_18.924931_11_plen_74_part_00
MPRCIEAALTITICSVVKPEVGDTLEQLMLLKAKLDKAQLYAGSRTTDLKDKHLKRIQHNEMLRIIGNVEVGC